MFLGLLAQLVAILIMALTLRKRATSSIGFLFVVMALIFHGFTEVAQLLFPGMNLYRNLTQGEDIDRWVLIAGFSIFLFVVGYVLGTRRSKFKIEENQLYSKWNTGLPDWRFILALLAPLYLVSVSGAQGSDLGYWVTGLTQQFLTLGIPLVAVLYLLRSRGKGYLVVILLQSLVFILLGQRLYVVMGFLVVIIVIARYGIRIPPIQQWLLVFIVGLFVLSITAMRLDTGRASFTDSGTTQRIDALSAGAQRLAEVGVDSNLINDFVYRFDGNAYPAMILDIVSKGHDFAGFTPFVNNIFLAVPSFLNPTKLASTVETRNDKAYFTAFYGIPQVADFIPTVIGTLFFYYGVLSLFPAMIVGGWLFARLDIWLAQRFTFFTLLFSIGLTSATVLMEQGVAVYILTLRGVVALYCLWRVLVAVGLLWKHPVKGQSSIAISDGLNLRKHAEESAHMEVRNF